MGDIFRKLSDFNLNLQCKYTNLLLVRDKATATKEKLKFWCENVNIDYVACFPLLQIFLWDDNLKTEHSVKSDIVRPLQELQKNFSSVFSLGNVQFRLGL